MKPVYLRFAFTVFLTLLASKCKETPPDPCPTHTDTKTLPSKTECGANNFGCLVNGEVWVPEIEPFKNGLLEVHAEYGSDGDLLISGGRNIEKDSVNQVVKLVLQSVDGEGIFYINRSSGDGIFSATFFDFGKYNWESDSLASGKVQITKFDRENYIISGTFEFTLIKPNYDTIRVTQGRFDVKE